MDKQDVRVIDVVRRPEHEKLLYRCLAPAPARKYRRRTSYIEAAAPNGLRKEILFLGGDAVGMIEYAPAGFSAYPMAGRGVWVMNCVWVLRRAKGRELGKVLMNRMIETAKGAHGFATISLEGHPSRWFILGEIVHLGFRSVDSMRMRGIFKRPEICFRTHLMWLPTRVDAEPPSMDWDRMLYGVDFCAWHPLYRAERYGSERICEFC